jgi:hypothetical protein
MLKFSSRSIVGSAFKKSSPPSLSSSFSASYIPKLKAEGLFCGIIDILSLRLGVITAILDLISLKLGS